MTRSLVVTTWFPDALHPSRTPFCLAHVHALQTAGIEVEVVHVQLGVSIPPLDEVYEGVPIVRVAARLTEPRSLFAAVGVIRRRLLRADVLHTMAFSSILVAALPWMLRRRPWVHTEHWNGVINPHAVGGWWRRLAFLRHALRLPHAVTAVTAQLANEMTHYSRPHATTVVPCVVHQPPTFVPYPPPAPLRLVGVGLVNERKNPLLAVETIAWLRDHGVEVSYQWIGDGPLAPEVRRAVEILDLRNHVTFSGTVDPTRVQRVIETAHMFFVPSAQENFFTALAESIAVGRPVVAPRSGGFTEYCSPENSELVSSWEVPDLGAAIVRAWERFRGTRPEDIASTVAHRFSPETVGEQFLAVYSDVLERRD